MALPGNFVVVGNWDRHKSPADNGLALFRFDADTGALQLVERVAPDLTVGAVALGRGSRTLFCVDEYDRLPGYFVGGGGQVYAFSIDGETGRLRERNHMASFGSLPSGVATSLSGRFLLVSHHTDRIGTTKIVSDNGGPFRIAVDYDDATTALFALHDDGSIGEIRDAYIHSGSGGPLPRQTHPQLHTVQRAPNADLFFVTDKGNDALVCFRIDELAGKIHKVGPGYRAPPGSSPRYVAFHPRQPFLFLNHETQAIVTSLRYDLAGGLAPLCTISSLPPDQPDAFEMKQSDLQVHPTGRFLYTLIRGTGSATVFSIDEATGKLTRLQTVRLDGAGPRACAISPDGKFMVIAALDSREVLVWAIGDDGRLSPTDTKVPQPNPGTVTFLPGWQAS